MDFKKLQFLYCFVSNLTFFKKGKTMKKLALTALSVVVLSTAMAADVKLANDIDKLSYSIGSDLGKNFKKQGIDINPTAMTQGMDDAIAGKKLMLTDDEMKTVMNTFQKALVEKRNKEFTKKADENKVKGTAFLTENKSKPGVVSLPSGLQYKIIEKGDGQKPTENDIVTVEYTGKLINGDVFDSTKKAGQPATFKVSQVIPGWIEALKLMPKGATWEIYVPSDLAYGSRSVGGPIGPNEALIFNIHLIDIKKAEAPKDVKKEDKSSAHHG
jgi:FKBP-type peptidyl-prolyl cis-trans isomerase FklB